MDELVQHLKTSGELEKFWNRKAIRNQNEARRAKKEDKERRRLAEGS